uniref:NADH-ubiquinone oxidoreductase chain 2 n=1 Tax=Xenorhina sp. TNHC-GDC 31177 TaxID=1933077 RepID=A0A343VTG9_9NEOB|nr:NADH dehydrogenase subunit 2 [Xenorhina sp. TNHC-GDC 31177]
MLGRLFLFLCVILGAVITSTTHHWFIAWMGLELNTLAFVPLIAMSKTPRAIEAAIKYFLIQTSASATMLYIVILNTLTYGQWNIPDLDSIIVIPIILALSAKLGVAPFHSWYADVLQGTSLFIGACLSTLQKIPPIALMYQIACYVNYTEVTFTNKFFIPLTMITLGLLSMMVGGWGGINQTEMRKILAYSSIAHMGWIIIITKILPDLAFITFTIYAIMTLTIFMNMYLLNVYSIKQLSMTWHKSPALTSITMLSILSLAGMPPLTGFFPKLLIAMELAKISLFLVCIVFIITSLSLYFYLRMTYFMLMTVFPSPPWKKELPYAALPFILLTVVAIMILPMTPFMIPSLPYIQ